MISNVIGVAFLVFWLTANRSCGDQFFDRGMQAPVGDDQPVVVEFEALNAEY